MVLVTEAVIYQLGIMSYENYNKGVRPVQICSKNIEM